jgi:hypothetical protein
MVALMPERIEALLAPDALHLRRTGAGVAQAVAAEADAEAWRAPLAALDRALRAQPPRAAPGGGRLPAAVADMLAPKLDIVLSEHFARWQLLPWQAEVETPGEKEAWARHSFREVYGEVSRHWQVRCAIQPPGAATPACAIDGGLLAALQALATAHGCRLDRLRPLLVAAAEPESRPAARPPLARPARRTAGRADGQRRPTRRPCHPRRHRRRHHAR